MMKIINQFFMFISFVFITSMRHTVPTLGICINWSSTDQTLLCTRNEVFHLLKKSLMENFIFCAVFSPVGTTVGSYFSAPQHSLAVAPKYW